MTNIEYNENKTRATFNGRLYYLRESQGYYYSPRKDRSGLDMLHRMVFIHYNGEIPKGYCIHHKDGNKGNNDISNLECVRRSEHSNYHGVNAPEELAEFRKRNLEENARPAANIWHGSAEGREWHKQHYEQMKDKLHEKVEAVCIVCGKKYMTTRKENAKCCSNACRAKDRRMSGLDDEVRVCEYCGKEFTINKYRKTRFCSKKCTMAVRKKEETRVCLYCGKEFTVKPSQKKVCCSRKCASNYFAKPMTEEQKQKLSVAHKGKKHTAETRKKLSESHKYIFLGENNPNYGKKHTAEAKERMRTSRKGKHILQYDLDGNFIREWEYMSLARQEYNLDKRSLQKACNGKLKTTGGYIWRYKEV